MNKAIKIISAAALLSTVPMVSAQAPQASDRAKDVANIKSFWTRDRIVSAQPRDLVLDMRGLAYLKGRGGKLIPYGHSTPAVPEPLAKGGNNGGGPGGGGPGGGGSGGGGGDTGFESVKNAAWSAGGMVQRAAGRLFFVMDSSGYVCSGTLIDDGETESDRSIILTAAHCVYDDLKKAFAESAIFIPNQAGTSAAGTDADCSNDPEGCWVADFGVVSDQWRATEFPNNIPADYGFYALGVNNSDPLYWSNEGKPDSMDKIIAPMKVSFGAANLGVYTRALGYSYSDDPNFMYCGEPVTGSSYDGYLLPNCGMSGGASGGPWSQSPEVDLGDGPVISVNSYGPSRGKKYMGGPRLDNNDASCLFEVVKNATVGHTTGIVGCEQALSN